MKILHFVKIKNFKIFGNEINVYLDQPSVLIGPNNSGKTSVLQAIALWSFGVKSWYESKGNTKATKNLSSGINRLNLTQIPVQNARYLWNNTEIRKGSTDLIPLEITIGIEFNEKIYECQLLFTQQSSELIYCVPNKEFYENKELLEFAAHINVDLLYSMSGVAIEEVLIPEGRINSLIGQGQTSEVLRNLCYMIFTKSKDDWAEMVDLMSKLFQIELQQPKFITTRGIIELKYKSKDIKNNLDIAMAGRGFQQFLLLFSYLFSHKNSVLLLDEPDAHLEILRQKTIYSILKRLTQSNGNQLIIATHSEVILEDAADTNLELILVGESVHLAEKKEIKNALRDFGLEHYYKARQKGSILYVEGSTDIDILKEFAKIAENQRAFDILDGNINYYYTQNNQPDNSLHVEIDIVQGAFLANYQKHFSALKTVVANFKGLAIFDSDGKNSLSQSNNSLSTIYWERYEIENYFIKPSVIYRWCKEELKIGGTFFEAQFNEVLNKCILQQIFNNNKKSFDEFIQLSDSLRDTYWLSITRSTKLSSFFEKVLENYHEVSGQPIPINKGRYYELVKYLPIDEVDIEVKNVLDKVVEVFEL
ncbi:MAG: ATP-binding protein [Paludibacter sp.]